MKPERWERIQTLFHEAAARSAHEQRAYLEAACRDDPSLVAEVAALLEEDARGASLLDRGIAEVAHELLGDTSAALPSLDIGPYRVLGLLGEGGMGVVYLAERTDLGSTAAVKLLRDATLSPARRERFATEQRMLARLTHPAIARLHDAGTLPDGTPWIVMEHVVGTPLTEYCAARQASVPERLRLLRAVAEAVQHAHRHLVIHRDLKPSNILVTTDGAVKLLDFGIAKQLESDDADVEQTRTGLRLMTPAYAAPEQVRGEQVGTHTDVYALGVLLYELLTGRLPYDLSNRTPSEAISIIVEREPERPSVVTRAAPPPGVAPTRGEWGDLDVLCLTAMHKDPQRRYRTADALIRDIDHYLGGEPLEARPDSAGYRARKFLRRNSRPVALAATAGVALVSLVTFYTVRLSDARIEAVAEAARTQRIQRFMLDLFRGGDETVGPADSLRVVTLVDRGLQEAQSLGSEPAIQAELYETLGGIYRQLGHLARADTLLHSALAQREALYGRTHEDVVASLVSLASLRDAQAQYDEAERLARDALARGEAALPREHPILAKARATLGVVLENRGNYTEAIPQLEDAVRRYSAGGPPTADLASSLTELANTHFYAGNFATSDSLNRIVLEMNRALHGDRHPMVADVMINLGAIQFEGTKYPEAERHYRDALAITQPWYGNEHPATAAALTMLGRAIVQQGRFDEADSVLRRALAIHERVHGANHPRVASTLNELGIIAQRRKDLDGAERYFRRMAEIYRVVYDDKHYVIGVALSNLAGVYQERRQFDEAERLFREVLRRYAETIAPEHQLVGIARVRLGRALLGKRRFADAIAESERGYALLAGQATPPQRWMNLAREDLAAAHDSLGHREQASRYRAELAAATGAAARP